MTDRTVRTAVLPVAGLGTRFLPATKAIPKEAIPVIDRPAIQYVVEECVGAGITDVLLVTARGKESLADHFDRAPELEAALAAKGKDDLLTEIVRLANLVEIHTVRQPEALGLGHAVLMAADHVGNRSFAVALGDDFMGPSETLLADMIKAHEETGRAVVALMEVPHEQIHLYGNVAVTETDRDGVFNVHELIEKPDPADAPSDLAIIGRYVLPGEAFEVLADTPPGRGGEIQLTDALATLAEDEPILGVRLDGKRYDVGDKLGYLKATVELALDREDLGPDLRAWLTDVLGA